jgi:hypothetical protein
MEMRKTRKTDSLQFVQKERSFWRTRNPCKRNDSKLQTDGQEKKRVSRRYKTTGKKEYSKGFDDLGTSAKVSSYFFCPISFAFSIHFVVIFGEMSSFVAKSLADAVAKSSMLFMPWALSCAALFSPIPLTLVSTLAKG